MNNIMAQHGSGIGYESYIFLHSTVSNELEEIPEKLLDPHGSLCLTSVSQLVSQLVSHT